MFHSWVLMWGHAGSRNSKLSFECRCILKLPKSPSGKLKVMFYIVLFSLGAHQSFDDICLFVCWILYCKIANWTVVTLVPESFWNDPWSWMDSTVFSFFSVFQFLRAWICACEKGFGPPTLGSAGHLKLLYSSKNRFHVCHGFQFWGYDIMCEILVV